MSNRGKRWTELVTSPMENSHFHGIPFRFRSTKQGDISVEMSPCKIYRCFSESASATRARLVRAKTMFLREYSENSTSNKYI